MLTGAIEVSDEVGDEIDVDEVREEEYSFEAVS
jgi:hypothetical protein